jgi:hypothetical protein
MTHVVDELELYALDALSAGDRARVLAHLGECPACREQARLLVEVAITLPDTLPQKDVPPRVRERILASARADLGVDTSRGVPRRSLSLSRLAIAGLAAAVIVLSVIQVMTMRHLSAAIAERDGYGDVVLRVSHGGRSWYMAGLDRWAGSGGTLYAPAKADAAPFVVFHDLRPVDPGALYALWLIDADGHWVRAASFVPTGLQAQAVILDAPIEGFAQCALTLETAREGKRGGPLVMQSRLAPAAR